MSEDPWECFGDDSSIEEEVEEHDDQAQNRLRLINKANNNSGAPDEDVKTQNSAANAISEIEYEYDLPPILNMWVNRQPLYFGPMAVVETLGSNRGYIATENLSPGTLLLVEEPIFRWPQEQIGSELGLSSIQAILENKHAQSIVHDMEHLYPTRNDVDSICRAKSDNDDNDDDNHNHNKNNHVDDDIDENQIVQIKDMIDILTMQYEGDKQLDQVLSISKRKRISNSQNSRSRETLEQDKIDIFRMLLALRYNGFDSGLYLHFAMFNHSCNANCIKFMPENEVKGNSNQRYSEVRTTKYVKKGEPLTLHYLNPREVSHATRRIHIWEQHRFDIGAQITGYDEELQVMDHVDGSLPSSSRDKQDHERTTFLVEKSLNDLQDLSRELKIASSTASTLSNDEAVEMFEHCKALEMAAEELIQASSDKLKNKQHLLLIRCCRLHLDCSEMLLRIGTTAGVLPPAMNLTHKQQLELMKKFVCTCHTLLSLQTQYLGRHHPDIARTNYDLAMGINSLLSRSPKTLFELNLPCLSSFNACQRFEGDCRKEHHRIDNLYPRDVEDKISTRR